MKTFELDFDFISKLTELINSVNSVSTQDTNHLTSSCDYCTGNCSGSCTCMAVNER